MSIKSLAESRSKLYSSKTISSSSQQNFDLNLSHDDIFIDLFVFI